ncbi:F-box only protein 4 isoform X2 [Anarrhichthys ocellatus]|uniref:F-box only protein 4 isoform X2 n=1 Tax=Anarrhichthys ocellatus TaxID=433405 RepID=UPI0012EDAD08|nr:F-box only protein 4 isoform X2 [Anarrhichthys ocellatus]
MSSLTINTRVVLRKTRFSCTLLKNTVPTMPHFSQQQGSKTGGCVVIAHSVDITVVLPSLRLLPLTSEIMAGQTQQLSESVVIRSLRRFRDRYFPNSGKVVKGSSTPVVDAVGEPQPGSLDSLPVDVQFLIMTLLSPADICILGATSRYWRAMVRDPVLWRYFLHRDMLNWPSIDHVSMPQLELLDAPLINEDESLDDREEWGDKGMESKVDYMSEYLKGCPSCRQQWLPSRPTYEVMTSFLQSLVPSSEPRYAMLGPGMEQLDVSLVTRLLRAPDVLPVSGTPHRQINGIGSGISYMFNNQHKFNILTLYSTNRAEREKARLQQQSISNKLFTFEGTDDSGCPIYSPAPQVQQVCQVVDGFIYVANAEPERGDGESEAAQIRAVLSCAEGSATRPLLVLSCVSREESEEVRITRLQTSNSRNRARCRTPCVNIAKRLGLLQLANPWMVQDTVAESLSGLLEGVSWLLRCSGVKLYGS